MWLTAGAPPVVLTITAEAAMIPEPLVLSSLVQVGEAPQSTCLYHCGILCLKDAGAGFRSDQLWLETL